MPPVLLALLVSSCEKSPEAGEPIKKEKISGFVQKGPYLVGTSLDLLELNADLGQTGKVFRTDIENNRGAFEINNLELSSSFVEISANGFYFNEVLGKNSSAQLTLSAVSDLSDKSTLNVNVLSHLEKDRLIDLVNGGMSFGDAKRKAQEEVLGAFMIEKGDIAESEMLNIADEGDDNAILLAVSVILQGYMDVPELHDYDRLGAKLRGTLRGSISYSIQVVTLGESDHTGPEQAGLLADYMDGLLRSVLEAPVPELHLSVEQFDTILADVRAAPELLAALRAAQPVIDEVARASGELFDQAATALEVVSAAIGKNVDADFAEVFEQDRWLRQKQLSITANIALLTSMYEGDVSAVDSLRSNLPSRQPRLRRRCRRKRSRRSSYPRSARIRHRKPRWKSCGSQLLRSRRW
jgi:hypothetical protein